jgi:glycerol transport system permease protein
MPPKRPIAALFYAVLIFAPVYWLVTASVKSNREIMSGFSLLPQNPDFTNLTTIITDPDWYWAISMH